MSNSTKRETLEIGGQPFNDAAINILSLQVDKGGCGHYRVRQYLEEFEKKGLANTYIMKASDSEEQLRESIEKADIVIARNGTLPMVKHLRKVMPNKKIVFDHDDNTFIVPWTSDHYKDFGVEDIYDTSNNPIWVTGVTKDFNKYENMHKQLETRYLLESATLVTSPVDKLSSYWGKFSPQAAVIPNGLSFELYPDVIVKDNTKGKNEVRIGWHGGGSHRGDIASIVKPFEELLQKNKNWYYHTVGVRFPEFFKTVKHRVIDYPWTEFKAHPLRLKMLDLDAAIIPLADEPFNDYKSEIKFTEFAALKVPMLVVDRLPYNTIAEDGVNCLTYSNEEEFKEKLVELIENKPLRKKLIKNAYEFAREERDIEKLAPEALDLYKQI